MVANWLPKFDGIVFFSHGANRYSHKIQHLLVTWGQIEKVLFYYYSLDS
jgi:hypothetical protein